jgi:hypothetical protein
MRRLLILLLALITTAFAAAPARATVVINEIMYDSNYSPDIEYIELHNTGPSAQNLGDWYLLDNSNTHPRCYLVGTLGVGQYLVIAADTALFRARFPGVANLNVKGFDPGGAGWGLGNSGDQVRLYDDNGLLRDSVQYATSGDWPADAAGHGPSAELVNPLLDNSVGTNWLASVPEGGTPGAANSRYSANAAPVCDNGGRSIQLPVATDAVAVTCRAVDPENHLIGVTLSVDTGAGFAGQPMFDDGAHGDGAAHDSIYGAIIPARPNGTVVKYYATATDNLGQFNTWPDGAPAEYRAYTVGYVPPRLVVNEIVAENLTGVLDDTGAHADWVEVHNPNPTAIDLGGFCLTDNLDNGGKWTIHAGTTIAAGGYLVFWADGDTTLGAMHADFKLSSSDGEEVGIFSPRDLGNVRLDGWKFGPVAADVSVGYKPDGNGIVIVGTRFVPEYLATPSPGASNNTSAYFSALCINEFQTTSAGGGTDDYIEFYNRGATTYDLSDCYLSDNRTSNTKYRFPAGTTLAAGHYLVISEATFGFNLATTGEVIVLTAADSTSGLDFFDFQQEAPDTSEGRSPDGTGRWAKFHPTTFGSANVGPLAVGQTARGRVALSGLKAAPSPFRGNTLFSFTLGQAGPVAVSVYDPAGRRVREIFRGSLAAGSYSMPWNGRDDGGAGLRSGVYFLRVSAGPVSRSCRLLMLN